MPRYALLAGAALLLGGCLSTKEPVFDETNSSAVGEIPEFIAFADAWDSYVAANGSPRELIAEGARGVVIDGIVVVQEHSDYTALAMIGGRPVTCVIYADDGIEAVAEAHGVTVEVDKPDDRSIDDASRNTARLSLRCWQLQRPFAKANRIAALSEKLEIVGSNSHIT